MANTFLPTSLSLTSTFQQLSTLLEAAGITDASENPVASLPGYIKNNDTAIAVYIGQGTSAPSSWATITAESAIKFDAGMNANEVWLKCASSTTTADFCEGASEYVPPLVNGVIGTITASENVVPKADADGNLIASTISDDASTVTVAADMSVTGTIVSDDATTPGLTIESGNTNTGFIDMKGKTSGKLRITAADATAQTVTLTTAAQTSGASSITIPDLAGAATGLATTTVAQTLTNKTLTAPVLNAGTVGTSLVPTTDDGAPLGDTTHNFSDLFLASGALINYANGNAVVTHSSGILTVSTGDLRVTTAGTNTASAVTVGGTQTLTAKTLTSPTINTGVIVAPNGATSTGLMITKMVTFTEDATSVSHVGTIAIPAGAWLHSIRVTSSVLWLAGAAVLKVGDTADDDGYFIGVDLKATDLLVGEILDTTESSLWGGKEGAYLVAATGRRGPTSSNFGQYYAAGSNILGTITVTTPGSTAGRTFMEVIYSVGEVIAAVPS